LTAILKTYYRNKVLRCNQRDDAAAKRCVEGTTLPRVTSVFDLEFSRWVGKWSGIRSDTHTVGRHTAHLPVKSETDAHY